MSRNLSASFDVVVSGSSGSVGRAELLRPLGELVVVDRYDADRFVAGEPLRVLRRANEAAAQALAEKLRTIGAVVAVEPSPPEFAMPSDISLMSLDGGEAPAMTAQPLPEPQPQAPPLPQPQSPPPVESAPPPRRRPLGDDAFTAPPIEQAVMELERPAPPKRAPQNSDPPPDEADPHAAPVEEQVEEDWQPIPGRLLQGKLRQNSLVRLGAGVALGLLLGYLFASPYADRAERRVAELRAAANLDRYRPVEEARANAARLDAEADDLASGAFIRMSLIWLGTAGVVVAGWYRIT